MAKIPKNLRKSLQPTKGAGGRAGGRGGSRQMRRMMDQLGIDMKEIPAREVIIKCDEYNLLISEPQVSIINQVWSGYIPNLGECRKNPEWRVP